MSRFRISLWSAIFAQTWVSAGLLFLALWPYSYRGVSAVAVNSNLESTAVLQPTEQPISFDQQSFNVSLIDVNGPRVLLIMLIPVAFATIALCAVAFQSLNRPLRIALLWASAVLMLVFSALALFSLGVFYLPAAVALVVAAIAGIGRPRPQGEPSLP